jgi:alcohol dehydrogenase class IV
LTIPGFDLEGWAQRVVFGVDGIHELGAELERLGRKRPLVVCSWRRRRSDEFRHLAGGLGMTPNVFQGAEEHVPRHVVEAAWRAAREQEADAIVSFGGGSTIDLGKAVAFIARNGLEALDAAHDLAAAPAPTGAQASGPPALAHVAVQTTYSGAEASGCFFVSERQESRRLAGTGIRPDVVVGDPSLTLTLPWKPTGGTGMTALANCVEGLTSHARTERTDSLAVRAARSIAGLLPIVSKSPDRVRERGEMMGAAYVAGMVSDLVGKALHQTVCIGLGARTGAPHGVAGAILLPYVMRLNLEAEEEGLARFAEAVGARDPAGAADAMEAMAARLGLPPRLREVGVFEQDLESVAAWTADRPEMRQGPRHVSVDHVLAILRAAW